MKYGNFFTFLLLTFFASTLSPRTVHAYGAHKMHHTHITYTNCDPETIRSSAALSAVLKSIVCTLYSNEEMQDPIIEYVQQGYSVLYLFKKTGHLALHVINKQNTVDLTITTADDLLSITVIEGVKRRLGADTFIVKRA
jgi:hypothetical protein